MYLAGFVVILMIVYYVYVFAILKVPSDDTLYYILAGMDLMLTGIPPGLSLCLMLGIHYGVENLKLDNIDCFEPRLVNAVGRVQTALFDKTGTLTESFMELEAVHLVDSENSKKIKILTFRKFRKNLEDSGSKLGRKVFQNVGAVFDL